jgi:hypothetical protein
MKFFTISELIKSDRYWKVVWNGTTPEIEQNLTALVGAILDPLRLAYGKPIKVNSGFRNEQLNRLVGGVKNSQHLRGEAADICCGDNERLAKIIEENGRYDQLIRYIGPGGKIRFIHVSWKSNGQNRKQVLRKA